MITAVRITQHSKMFQLTGKTTNSLGEEQTTVTATAVVALVFLLFLPASLPSLFHSLEWNVPCLNTATVAVLVIIFLMGMGRVLRVSHFSIRESFITIQASYNLITCLTWRITGLLDPILLVVRIFAPVLWKVQKCTG